MSSNVIPITRNASRNRQSLQVLSNQELREMIGLNDPPKPNGLSALGRQDILESLEEASAEFRTKTLALRHEKERAAREFARQEAEFDTQLEAAAYTAFMNGVPQEDIYALDDERLSDALSFAIQKVGMQA